MTEETPITTLPIKKSKTVAFNTGSFVAALAFIVAAFSLPEVTALIPQWAMAAVIAITAIVNLYLRIYKTTQPIEL